MASPIFAGPTFDAPIVDTKTGRLTRPWFLALQSLWDPAPESSVTAGSSPFAFTVNQPGALLVSGGNVSAISFKRTTTTVLGITSGFIPCGVGDVITITYTVAPTLVFFPR